MHQLYAFGSNGSGQLGLGHEDDCSQPQPVNLGEYANDASIRAIVAGGNHTLLLLDNGLVMASGSSEQGQCDRTASHQASSSRFVPVKFERPIKIRYLAATWTTSIFVDVDSQVYVTGTGLKGELGLGDGTTQAASPVLIREFPPKGTAIVSLSSCMAHTVAVLSNGEIYGWGNGRKGQLGNPPEHVWQPRKIDNVPFHVAQAACGKDFTCVLGDDGEVLLLGPNKFDRFKVKESAPERALGTSRVIASWGTVVILDTQAGGLHYHAWGRDDHGQKPPPQLPPLKAMSPGSEHFLATTTASDQLLAWGWGEHGNCASPVDESGDVRGRHNHVEVPHKVVAIFAGCATSFVLTEQMTSEPG